MDAEKLYNLYTQLDEKERVKFGIKTRRFEAEEGLRKSNTKEKLFNELTNIKANFIYNFDQKIANLSNILIDDKDNQDVNKTLESLIFKKNKLQNRIYLKSILNKALKFYAG